MKIRPENSSDFAAISEVHTLAFGRPDEAHLVECLRQRGDYIPALALVAEVDQVIVGHIFFSPISLEGSELPQTHQGLALAPLAVKPAYQNQGIGSALVQSSLAIAEQQQSPFIIVLGDPSFYQRFSFKPAIAAGIQAPFDVPEEAFMIWQSSHYQADAKGTVTYSPCFNDL